MTALLSGREVRQRVDAAGDDPAHRLQTAYDQLRAQIKRVERRDGAEAADLLRDHVTDLLIDAIEGGAR